MDWLACGDLGAALEALGDGLPLVKPVLLLAGLAGLVVIFFGGPLWSRTDST